MISDVDKKSVLIHLTCKELHTLLFPVGLHFVWVGTCTIHDKQPRLTYNEPLSKQCKHSTSIA